jgi:hypothetical protein
MDLTALMLDQLATARSILESGDELVPAWRIATPEATYLIFTRFDHDKPEQRERTLALMGRFMIWKMALSYVLTTETWIGPETTRTGEEALLAVGVSRSERLAAMQWFGRADVVTFDLFPPVSTRECIAHCGRDCGAREDVWA